ncbi:MAG: non-ribosomal peptide synthetase, partial [bacterium]|nr:non-ribosomal peptide synthetase [bacterium]
MREGNKSKLKKQEAHWLKIFDDENPVLDLPLDFTRPAVQSYEGRTLEFEVAGEATAALKQIATQNKITLYMIIQALFVILLAKITNKEDIIIGTPVAGRRHRDLENIIGMFVNTLALRNKPANEKTIRQYLQEVKEATIKAFDNQEYPFEQLVEKVVVDRENTRNPIFDVMFVLQNLELTEKTVAGLKLKPIPLENKIAKFDLMLVAMESENELHFNMEYSTKLFKKKTIERFINYFKTIITRTIAEPDLCLGDIEILTQPEKEQILYEFNETETQYPKDRTIHEHFEQQARRNPHRIAVKNRDKTVTYSELDKKAA